MTQNSVKNSFLGQLQNASDFLFGYDYFISYAHDDGYDYPQNLARELKERYNFTVFLDTESYVAGTELNAATKRRVKMSKYLLVLGRPIALKSDWVLKETKACLEAKKTPVVLDIDQCFENDKDSELKKLLEHRIYISEPSTKDPKEPSLDTLENLYQGYKGMRREKVRKNSLGLALVFFILLSVFAGGQWRLAESRYVEARHQLGAAYFDLRLKPTGSGESN